MEIDKKIIKKLIEALEGLKKSLNNNEIISSDESIEEEIEISKTVIKSPIVGTAYLAPEPGAKPFISVGKKIKKGETVMIVEAMKTMNHVPSTLDGVVKKICVEDGQPVEFGQTIIILD
jgi:acetyl-CoA carboxylase biotin carboxyl carrier protein